MSVIPDTWNAEIKGIVDTDKLEPKVSETKSQPTR
jgi:hypothetical protein